MRWLLKRGTTRKWTEKNGVIADISCTSCFCTSNTLILLSTITTSTYIYIYIYIRIYAQKNGHDWGCSSVWYVDQLKEQDDSYILHTLVTVIFTVCSTVDSSQVQSSKLLQGGNPLTISVQTLVIKGVILTFSVLQDHSLAVRKLMANCN